MLLLIFLFINMFFVYLIFLLYKEWRRYWNKENQSNSGKVFNYLYDLGYYDGLRPIPIRLMRGVWIWFMWKVFKKNLYN